MARHGHVRPLIGKRHATDGSSPGTWHQCGIVLVTGTGMQYDTATIFGRFQPMSAGFPPRRPLTAPWTGLAPEVPLARARPLSPPAPFDRVVGEAPALQTVRAQRRQFLKAFQSLGEAGSSHCFGL
jgi:hypothetical protein